MLDIGELHDPHHCGHHIDNRPHDDGYCHPLPILLSGLVRNQLSLDKPLYTVCEIANWCSHYGKQCGAPQKTKNRVTI